MCPDTFAKRGPKEMIPSQRIISLRKKAGVGEKEAVVAG
jgi:hypothetical protein